MVENIFVRKQLAFYQEREIKPCRIDNPARSTLVRLSRWFDWPNALAVVTLKTKGMVSTEQAELSLAPS